MKSIKTVLLTTMLTLVVALFAVQGFVNFTQFGQSMTAEIQKSLVFQAEKEASLLNQRLVAVGKNGEYLSLDLSGTDRLTNPAFLETIKLHVANDPMIFGSGCWLEPYVGDAKRKYYGPYVFKENGKPKLTWEYNSAKYDYPKYDWYRNGFKTDKASVWSEPYYDPVAKVTMITCTSPIRRGGKVIGVTTTDISLNQIQEYTTKAAVGEKGYLFLITGQGFYFGHRNAERNLKEKINESKNPFIKELGQKIVAATEAQVQRADLDGAKSFVAYTPIGDTGLKMVTVIPESEVYAGLHRTLRINVYVLILSLGLFALLLSTVATRRVLRPLQLTVALLKDIAEGEGDLTKRLDESGCSETSEMARWFNLFIGKIQRVVIDLKAEAVTLSDAAKELEGISGKLAIEIESLDGRSHSVAAAAEQSSQNVAAVSAAAEQSTSNTNIVASSAEEMNASIMEIAHNAESARRNASDAVSSVKQASRQVTQLEKEANAIEQVTQMIVEIAEQTKLLALNATIEAARAGESGKGFTVVASEVKELARQTNTASEDIRQKIETMLRSMGATVAEIEQSAKAIDHVDEVISSIAASVEEQSIATRDISSNISQSALSLKEVVSNIHQNVATIGGIANDITAVSQASLGVSQASVQVIDSASLVSRSGATLKRLVDQFKIE